MDPTLFLFVAYSVGQQVAELFKNIVNFATRRAAGGVGVAAAAVGAGNGADVDAAFRP